MLVLFYFPLILNTLWEGRDRVSSRGGGGGGVGLPGRLQACV